MAVQSQQQGGGSPQIKIRYPKNNVTIPSRSFAATGTAVGITGPINGYLRNAANQTFPGQVVLGPPDHPRWLIAFKDIPVGGPYTLIVEAVAGTPRDEVSGLIVQSTFAPVILYPPCHQSYCNENFLAYGVADPQVDTATMNGIDADFIHRDGFFWAALWFLLAEDTYVLVVTDFDGSASQCEGLVLDNDLCLV